MKIGQKIIGGFGVTLALFVAIGGLSYQGFQRMARRDEHVAHTREVLVGLGDLNGSLAEAESSQRGYLLTGKDAFLEQHAQSVRGVEKARARVRQLTVDNELQQRALTDVEGPLATRFADMRAAIDVRREKGLEAASAAAVAAAARGTMEEIRAKLGAMREEELRLLGQREAEAKATTASAYSVILYGSAVAIALAIAAAWWILRSITRPIGELITAAEAIGRGELEHKVTVGGEDEIGTLAAAFAAMTESLRTARDVERAKQRVEKLLDAINDTTSQLGSAGAEILAATSQQASGTQQQAAAVAQTVTTVDEVLQTSEQALQRARAVAEAAQRSTEVSKAGRRAIDDSTSAMTTVKDQAEASAESILALAEQAQAIGDIITTVNDIAEQTNMLALNAAIEASRAGEHGRGFGIVAAEVKALADQSKKATTQVRQILGEIQKATNAAVLATEESTRSVHATTRVIAQAGETIRSLAETVAEASQAAAQIAASASQQVAGMAQIHQAMRNINQITTQNLTSNRQTEQGVRDLSALGNRLRELLGGYGR